jgi:5-methylcytosine-specific restriction endonuclease McrBC regulatory subunit McrC
MRTWRRQPVSSKVFCEGLQAIEWTAEERGLAGLSELTGLSWQMDMESFFEAWVETIAEQVATASGGRLRVGRKEQTRVALDWRPPQLGAQRSLVPDIVIERADCTMVIDAKYKSHAEELRMAGSRSLDDAIRERHRADLLQVLAYSTLFDTSRVVACLVYPCLPATFASLRDRGQLISRTVVPAGTRRVEFVLASAPMGSNAQETISALSHAFLQPLVA